MTTHSLVLSVALQVALLCGCRSPSAETQAAKETVPTSTPSNMPAATTTTSGGAATVAATPTRIGLLTLVNKSSEVCMVNNMYMGREQIPVEVDGKTYFGCCPMCKGRLAKEEAARVAVDPHSKRKIDKSQAVMAYSEDGKIEYFESRENLERFAQTKAN